MHKVLLDGDCEEEAAGGKSFPLLCRTFFCNQDYKDSHRIFLLQQHLSQL